MLGSMKAAARRLTLEIVGWTLLVAGIAALVLPGPGLLMVFAGMAVLSQQYDWAAKRLDPVKYRAMRGAADGVATGGIVYGYGNSSLRAGLELLSPKQGISLGDDAADGGWSHLLYTVTPGIPGDSGSAFLSADGKAVGTLSTLGLTPFPLSNNIGDLARELAFAQEHSGIPGLKLALGTEPFSPLF